MATGEPYSPYRRWDDIVVIPTWLLLREEISLSAKVVFARLARFAGKECEANPLVATLARELGTGERNVQNALSELARAGLVSTPYSKGGRGNSSRFIFTEHPWETEFEASEKGERVKGCNGERVKGCKGERVQRIPLKRVNSRAGDPYEEYLSGKCSKQGAGERDHSSEAVDDDQPSDERTLHQDNGNQSNDVPNGAEVKPEPTDESGSLGQVIIESGNNSEPPGNPQRGATAPVTPNPENKPSPPWVLAKREPLLGEVDEWWTAQARSLATDPEIAQAFIEATGCDMAGSPLAEFCAGILGQVKLGRMPTADTLRRASAEANREFQRTCRKNGRDYRGICPAKWLATSVRSLLAAQKSVPESSGDRAARQEMPVERDLDYPPPGYPASDWDSLPGHLRLHFWNGFQQQAEQRSRAAK